MWTVHGIQASLLVFAQAGRAEWELCLPVGALFGVLGLGWWAILKVKRWREEALDGETLTPEQQLEHFQKMAEDGLLDPQELAKIQTRLEGRIEEPPPQQPPSTTAFQPPNDSIREE